jgi:HEAT repeat protein
MIYIGIDSYYDILAARGMFSNNIEEIYSCLKDKDYRVRSLAAQTIQVDYPTQKSFDIATEMLSSNKYYEREIGAYILGQLGTPKMPYIKESLPLLDKILNDKSKQVVSTAISSIGHLWSHTKVYKNEDMINKIIKFTHNKSSNIRISAVMALSSVNNIDDIETIIRNIIINDQNEEVREWAEVALEILLDIKTLKL